MKFFMRINGKHKFPADHIDTYAENGTVTDECTIPCDTFIKPISVDKIELVDDNDELWAMRRLFYPQYADANTRLTFIWSFAVGR